MKALQPCLTIVGDISVDLVMGPIAEWPRIGTETIVGHSEMRAGGSATNAAMAVMYLGGSAQLVTAVGNDHFGAWLQEKMQSHGEALLVCQASTTVSIGMVHNDSERTFFTTNGHLADISYQHIRSQLRPAPQPASIALLSGVFLTPLLRQSYAALISLLRELGYQIALDTNWPAQGWDAAVRREVIDWMAQCDHVLLNELEVSQLADTDNLQEAIHRLCAHLKPNATLVVKIGSRGAIGVQNGRQVEVPAPVVQVRDTIGAGDSFNAGYLLARIAHAQLGQALAAGCNAASAIISRSPRTDIQTGELAHLLPVQHKPMVEQQ